MARAINYLNNKDILKEIHKSKIAYCSYTLPTYSEYDIIIKDLSEIPKLLKKSTKKTLVDDVEIKEIVPPAAKVARANRLVAVAQDALMVDGKKSKSEFLAIDPYSILDQDIIFRLMTWGHIPEAPYVAPKTPKGKKNKIVIEDDSDLLVTEYDEEVPEVKAPSPKFMKVNFPPFQHYKLDENGTPVIVGKSHWVGDIETGSFSKDHGRITNKLAMMYMKLCERYATRSNWRGYTYVDEMKSQALLQLSQIGLQFDESKSANPFAYYTMALQNSFTRVLNSEKRNQNIRDDILEMNNLAPSYSRQNSGSSSDNHGTGHEE